MPTANNSVKQKLYEALPNVSLKVAEASLSVWELSGTKGNNSLESIIIARVLKVLRVLLQSKSLGQAAASSSDFELLLTLLSDPTVLTDLKHIDPLAAPKLRGLRAKEEIMNAEGGCLTAQEAATIARVTKAAISKARKEGRLIGLPIGQKSWLFPRWQFTESGGFLPGLKEVIAELNSLSPWGQAMFLLEPNDRLSGKTPVYCMRHAKIDQVILVASQHGEQGAPESGGKYNKIELPKRTISHNTMVYRTFRPWRGLGEALYFSKLGSERFDDSSKEFGVCYWGWDLYGAFIECFRQRRRFKYVEEAEIAESSVLTVKLVKPLTLLDITSNGLARLGETAYLTSSQSYSEPQIFSRNIYNHPDKIDGIFYRTRHDPNRFGIALYERAKHKVHGVVHQSWSDRPELAEILDHYDLGLI